MRNHAMVLVEAESRAGASTLARQLAVSLGSRAVLMDGRSAKARGLPSARKPPSARAALILDDADEARAAQFSDWLAGEPSRANEGRPRLLLIGGPFSPRDGYPTLRLKPFSLFEVGRSSIRRHWLRGAYPEAFTAGGDEEALDICRRLASDLSYRRLRDWGFALDPDRTFLLLEFMASRNGFSFNANEAGRRLGVGRRAILNAAATMERAGIARLVESLNPSANARTVRAPALYLRDTGLLHGLLGFRTGLDLDVHERAAAASWASYVIEQSASVLPAGYALARYLSADGACLELVVVESAHDKIIPTGKPVLGAAIRTAVRSGPGRGAVSAADRLGLISQGRFVVTQEIRPAAGGFRQVGLPEFLDILQGGLADGLV